MSALITFIVGMVLGAVFQDFFKGITNSWFVRFGNTVSRNFLSKKSRVFQDLNYFSLGNRRTELVVIDGNGVAEYSPDTLVATYRDGSPNSPDAVSDRILTVEREMEIDRENGNTAVWDGIGVGLSSYAILRNSSETKLAMNLELYKSRFAAFKATVVALGSEDRENVNSLYSMYLKDRDPRNIQPFLARHVGVVGLVVTSDGYLVASRRSGRTSVRMGEIDASFAEGIEPTKDADASGNVTLINIYSSFQRGCEEELGFVPLVADVHVLGFAVEMQYYQFCFVGVIETNKSFEDIAQLRNGRAKDSWESELVPVPHKIDDVLTFVAENKSWGFFPLLAYWSLLRKNLRAIVDARAGQILSGL